jgi:hypothetical protein
VVGIHDVVTDLELDMRYFRDVEVLQRLFH